MGAKVKPKFGVVAVDLGASGGRFASGHYDEDGVLQWKIIEQIHHQPKQWNGHEVWDIDCLLGLCRRAAQYGSETYEKAAIGIDTWGVDIGFIDSQNSLLQPVICYRDTSHTLQFEKLKSHRRWLFKETGIAHQPFNTIYQLAARKEENPDLLIHSDWLLLPDLLGTLLGAKRNYELTEASTTQLMNLECKWCDGIFSWLEIQKPKLEPEHPGTIGNRLPEFKNVSIAHVGSHDTASAVVGFEGLQPSDMFLNIGTWTLAGTLISQPITSIEAENSGFTNERAANGSVRFLKNIPGFYVFTRILEEINCGQLVGDWISSAGGWEETVDFNELQFFNPRSMTQAVLNSVKQKPTTPQEWASLAVASFVKNIGSQTQLISDLTRNPIQRIVVGGGGAKSESLIERIETESGLNVIKGPTEATVYGNLKIGLGALKKHIDMHGGC